MGLFDNIAKRNKEKTIDNTIEKAKQLIAKREYGEARYLLGILKEEYRKDDILALRKKAYPVEVQTLVDERDAAYECGYRSSHLVHSVKSADEVKNNCHKGCSYQGADGSRAFCRISEHERYSALAKKFTDYWGGRVFFIIEDENRVYMLAVEADKELWTYDRVMAYCIEDENVENARYDEIKLDVENGIPVIEKYTPQHKAEKDKYIEKVKSLFKLKNYREVVETVAYMDEHLFTDYRAEDMAEIYDICNKSKDILWKLQCAQKEEALLRLDMLAKEGKMDGKAFIWLKNGFLCCSTEDSDGVPTIKQLETDDDLYMLAKQYEEELGCMVYHIVDNDTTAYLLTVYKEADYWAEERPDGDKIEAMIFSLEEDDYYYSMVRIFNNGGALGIEEIEEEEYPEAVETEDTEEFEENAETEDTEEFEETVETEDNEAAEGGAEVETEEDIEKTITEEEKVDVPQHIDGYNAEQWFNTGFRYLNGDGVAKNLSKALVCMENAAKLGSLAAMHNCSIMYSEGQGTAADDEKAGYWCRKAAEKGHSKAMYNLAWMYFKGIGYQNDDAEGFMWLQKAAEAGHAAACFELAEIYAKGHSTVPQDKTKALYWYEKAAGLGDDDAMMKCFCAYVDGEGCEKDVEKGVYWLEEAVKKENAEALSRVGEMELRSAKTQEDVKRILATYLIPAANKGDAEALFLCAGAFCAGSGVEKDEAKALELYEHSAKRGCEFAQKFLVKVYTEGGIAQPDSEKALYWKEKLAENNAELAVELADMYASMDGEENAEKSAKWLSRAIQLGNINAMLTIAQIYRNNNEEEGVFRYELMAAEHGDVESMHNTAVNYYMGIGTEKDIAKSLYWYEKAAEAGYILDQCNCAVVYSNGKDVEVDFDKAFFWIQKALENAEKAEDKLKTEIYYYAALFYCTGSGTETDGKKAYELYEKAALLGKKDAYQRLVYNGMRDLAGDSDTAFYWAVKAAEEGDGGELLFYGGEMYGSGEDDVPMDEEESIRWMEKAAEFGHFGAMYLAGIYYFNDGSGKKYDDNKALYWLEKAYDNIDIYEDDELKCEIFNMLAELNRFTDDEKAYQYYQMAAELGDIGAINNCCSMCLNGWVSEAGNDNALWWAEKAAKLGNTSILMDVAELFDEEDNAFPLDKAESLRWYEMAAEYDDVNAMISAAKMYHYGEGCTKNLRKSSYWLEKAAERGNTSCMVILAENYDKGVGVEQDDKKTFYWYQKAAEGGDPIGMYNAALRHLLGIGTEVSLQKAKHWLKEAEKSGNVDVQKGIAKLKEKFGFILG